MILVLGGIGMIPIGIILIIIGSHLEKVWDFDEDDFSIASAFGSIFLIFGLFFTAFFGTGALICHSDYKNDIIRQRLEEDRASVIAELKREDTDVLLKGIEDAKEFNEEIRKNQRNLESPWFNWITPSVYNEFDPIEY
jgi:hypothetical protein